MRRTVTALTALSFGVVALGTIVWAVDAPQPAGSPNASPKPPLVGKPAAPAEPNSLDVLRGRPDVPKTTQPADELVSPDVVQFRAAGIALRPIGDSRVLRKYGSDEIVEFVNDSRKWSLKVALIRADRPIGLTQTVDLSGNKVAGLIDVNIDRLKRELPAMKLLRKETVNIGDGGVPSEDPALHVPNVGMLAFRYTKGVERLLSQQAIIQSNERIYYLITLTSPGRAEANKGDAAPKAANPPAAVPAPNPDAPETGEVQVVTEQGSDPGERTAVEAFEQIIDSVKLLDRTKLKEDQDQRLFKTRSLFVNITEAKLTKLLIPKQWFRVIQGGKDVGYVYSEESIADGIPQRDELQRAGGTHAQVGTGDKGVLIGSRSRMKSGLRQIDSESWMFITIDRKHEDWSTITLVSDLKSGKKDNIMTLGTSDRQQSRSFDHEGLEKGYKGDQFDPNQPPVKMGEEYSLTVNRYASKETPEPVTKRLPPFYLPQAMGYMLPRLVTLNIPKQYMFASYVPDMSQVMLRYVDVGEEQHVTLAGRAVRAIPVTDKLTLDGAVTTHYMSRDGQYLGSVTKETGITIIPSDEKTLMEIWKDANLSRPADVQAVDSAAVSHAGGAAPLVNPTGTEPARTPVQAGPPAPGTTTTTPRRLAPRDRTNPK